VQAVPRVIQPGVPTRRHRADGSVSCSTLKKPSIQKDEKPGIPVRPARLQVVRHHADARQSIANTLNGSILGHRAAM
jgi:hypothetical protein